MGNRYQVQRLGVTPTADQDVLTIVSASNRRARPVQVTLVGRGSSSAPQSLRLARSSGGTTGGGAQTQSKGEHTDQPAAASVVNTTWSAQPTVEAHGVVIGMNALGGAIVYNVPKGMFEARNGENISLRATAGNTYQSMDVTVVFEED